MFACISACISSGSGIAAVDSVTIGGCSIVVIGGDATTAGLVVVTPSPTSSVTSATGVVNAGAGASGVVMADDEVEPGVVTAEAVDPGTGDELEALLLVVTQT